MMGYKYYAWCPECFDSLNCIEIKNSNKMIIAHEYYCCSCDKVFILNVKGEKDERN